MDQHPPDSSPQPQLSGLILLGAILFLGGSGQALLLARPPLLVPGVLLLVGAGGLFVLMGRWTRRTSTIPLPGWLQPIMRVVDMAPVGVGLAMGGVALGLIAFWIHPVPAMRPWPVLVAWGMGMLLFVAGVWWTGRQRRSVTPATASGWAGLRSQVAYEQEPPHTARRTLRKRKIGPLPALSQRGVSTPESVPIARWEVVALLALTIAAFVLRFVAIDTIPNNISGDEGEMGMVAREVLAGQHTDPFITGWLSHPMMWFFLQALSLHLFGDDIGGLRMLSVLIGTATIPAFYGFARLLHGRTTALLAATLMTVYHLHVHYSRYALNNIADGLFGMVFFGALFYGWRKRSPVGFALAGVALGVAQHFYMGTRLFIVLFAVVLLHQFVTNWRYLLRLRWYLALLAVGVVLGFGPLLSHYIQRPDTFTARMDVMGITGEWVQNQIKGREPVDFMREQVHYSFGAFTLEPERDDAQYNPGIPLLDAVSSVWLFFGLGVVLLRWRRVDMVLLLAWLVGTAFFGGVLFWKPPSSARYVTTAPALCLLIALAIGQFALIVQRSMRLSPRSVPVIGALLVLPLLVWNLHFYFQVFTPRPNFATTEMSNEIGTYLARQSDGVYVYFLGGKTYFNHGPIRFLAPDVPGTDLREPLDDLDTLPPVPARHRPMFILAPQRYGELERITRRYPEGVLYAPKDPAAPGGALFMAYKPARW
jgi:4-amino-4-deoxy-L-arabinose transferase-like glycosyltransferase